LLGVSDFMMLHLSQCSTLSLAPFHHLNVCLLFVNKKLPPFDQILWKVEPENVKCGSNK
jgi:hypothetical protein